MATTTINVSTVMESINNANNNISNQESSLGNIDKTVNSMSGVWEAEDQRAYAEQFQITKKKIENFNNSVKESLRNMQNYVNDCVAADNQTGQDIRSVSW